MSLVRAGRERSRTRRWPRSSSGRWKRRRPTRPTGRSVRWPGRAGCRTRRSGGYGSGPSACSRTARRPSSSPAIRLFVDFKVRDIVGLGLGCRRRTARWCSVSTKKARSRHSIAHNAGPADAAAACLSAAHTLYKLCHGGRPRCSPPSMSPPASSSATCYKALRRRQGGLDPDGIDRTKGGRNSKHHAVCDAKGTPLILTAAGQGHDCWSPERCTRSHPPAAELVASKDDSKALRTAGRTRN